MTVFDFGSSYIFKQFSKSERLTSVLKLFQQNGNVLKSHFHMQCSVRW